MLAQRLPLPKQPALLLLRAQELAVQPAQMQVQWVQKLVRVRVRVRGRGLA